MTITTTGQKAVISRSIIAGQPRSYSIVDVVSIEGDRLTYTTEANPSWFSEVDRDNLATWTLVEDEPIRAAYKGGQTYPKGPAAIEFLTGPNAGRDEPYAGTTSREDWADHKAAEVVTHFGTQVDPRPLIAAALRDSYSRGYGVAASAVAS